MNDPNSVDPNATTEQTPQVQTFNSTFDVSRPYADTSEIIARGGDMPTKRGRELPTIPGYEILAELGRGGMGVVYKARQTRLNRLVALKMVLAGAHAGAPLLARFDREARSVARLQHANIVQIFEIGEHDGLPFFCLEFVDGGPLRDLIDRCPQPPRLAAELVEILARAMHFAHEQNIIHRDLKPENILLTWSAPPSSASVSMKPGSRDRFSSLVKTPEPTTVAAPLTPKITDFGLAKAVEEASPENTVSGTILGTPSYMAPEQARGDVSALGPLCDLYSLGAILYELLTGRPPFRGATMLDTLDQVRQREPVPVRQLQPSVPPDLETICLKCLQKEPAKRYATCAALADDLAKFLAGRPIAARPVSGPERFWRWCRRNPWIAGLTAASVLFLISTTALALWSAASLAAKNKTIAQEKSAAVKSAAEEKKAKTAALAAEKTAAEDARLANEQAAIALTTLQRLIDRVQTEKNLEAAPETLEFKRFMMQVALEGVKQVSKRGEGSTSVEATQAAAHMSLGSMFVQLGKMNEAAAEFRKVYEIAKARVVLKKGNDASRRNLAVALQSLAEVEKEIGRDMRASLAHLKEALALWEDIDARPKADDQGLGVTKKDDVKTGLSEMQARVGVTCLRLGDPSGARPHFSKSLAIRRERCQDDPANLVYRLDLARALLAMGDVGFRVNDRKNAEASMQECLRIVEDVLRQKPSILGVKQELARACSLTGDYHLRTGDPKTARPLYERALALNEQIVKADSKKFDYQWDLAFAHYRLGLLALRTSDAAGARAHFERCRTLRETFATQDASNDKRRMELMLALAHCGRHERAAAIAAKLLRGAVDAELLIDSARCYSQCAAASGGDAGLRDRYTKEAIRLVQSAVDQGYRDVAYLSTEVDFDPLRAEPEFQRVLKAVRRD